MSVCIVYLSFTRSYTRVRGVKNLCLMDIFFKKQESVKPPKSGMQLMR